MNKLKVTVKKETKELVMERTFDAPRDLVWKAWTTDMVNEWWGPTDWKTTTHERDVKPGGQWKYCMESPTGQLSCGITSYKEIVAPEKIVCTDVFSDKDFNIMENMPFLDIVINFKDEGDKTTVISSTFFKTVEELEKVVAMGVEAGYGQQLDRLDILLANKQNKIS